MRSAYSGEAGGSNGYTPRVLIADDDRDLRAELRDSLEESGFTITEAGSGAETVARASATGDERPDVILLDYRMDVDGLSVLRQLKDKGVEAPVIMMTGVANGEMAAQAIQGGAANYLGKPFDDVDSVAETIRHEYEYAQLKRGENVAQLLNVSVDRSERIIGVTPQMIDVFKMVGLVAKTSATIVITGETGVGKEMIAEEIHARSDRRNGPLIKINCAAQPESLLESLLFGHEKGSFTGAMTQHKGYFEVAHRGAILLDEIGEMSLHLQAKLLRVLQDQQFERVGGTEPVKVDVRVMAATNRNLRQAVDEGRFREDLYYRLYVVEIHIPPLRERMRDVPLLVSHFLDKHRYSPRSAPARITQEAADKLMTHDWPGNVRELENVIQRAVALSQGEIITRNHISFGASSSRAVVDVDEALRAGATLEDMMTRLRREAITAALRASDHNLARAAERLNITLEELEDYRAERVRESR
ncbi:MAG TPA: sigma-54 dependent transcriptional regulator [Ktedonobacterales bacterium]|nr:sigma-54 dependent transcriptional regulator [Ktedonobacterales bacterium]